GKRDVGLDRVALPFLGDGPARFDLMQHHLVAALLRCGDDGDEIVLLQAIEGVERIDGFGGVANDDEDFVHGGGVGRGEWRKRWLVECKVFVENRESRYPWPGAWSRNQAASAGKNWEYRIRV